MRDLNYDFKQLCRRNRDGSYATQADREHILDLCADQLHEMGTRELRAQGFKPKHVKLLVDRWLAQKIGKENIVERTNATYGIPDRVYVTNAHNDTVSVISLARTCSMVPPNRTTTVAPMSTTMRPLPCRG